MAMVSNSGTMDESETELRSRVFRQMAASQEAAILQGQEIGKDLRRAKRRRRLWQLRYLPLLTATWLARIARNLLRRLGAP